MELQDHYSSHGQFIGGTWLPGEQGSVEMLNPATEGVLGAVKPASAAQVRAAIDAAYCGRGAVRALTAWERSALLRRAAALILERSESLGRLVALETGKPIRQAVGEAKASAESIDWFADEARRIFGQSYESRVKGDRYLVHMEPLGVVAAFVPWNFPLLLLARKMAPALAAGNTLVIRPSSEAAGATMALVKCFQDAGFPPGSINLVIGRPADVTPAIMDDARVAKVSFTGSVPVGRQIVAQSAATLKRVSMELGGHAPVIVHADADIDAFAKLAAQGKFRNAGQVCASPTRFYVHESIAAKVEEKLAEATRALTVGSPLDDVTDLGPLTTARRREAIEKMVDEAVSTGARVITGGTRPQGLDRGYFYAPTWLTQLQPSASVLNEEPFGPIGTIAPFATLDEVIAEANRLPFALAAYVFTRSLAKTHATVDRLEAGVIGVNTFVASTAETPFGGSKDSGYGREGGPHAIRDYLDSKFINVAMPAEAE
ncbi:NAD-dependent succinate-semialdehyde dehydrogenase [Aquincola sp. MAHUQ-54]|uniref:NAD-dependent succinate-semialdehyde dehydrogenase n=1 Tax=Aquincola agrisoli TaxID=3119538 RepID=A0AAW9QBE8_9BURK